MKYQRQRVLFQKGSFRFYRFCFGFLHVYIFDYHGDHCQSSCCFVVGAQKDVAVTVCSMCSIITCSFNFLVEFPLYWFLLHAYSAMRSSAHLRRNEVAVMRGGTPTSVHQVLLTPMSVCCPSASTEKPATGNKIKYDKNLSD